MMLPIGWKVEEIIIQSEKMLSVGGLAAGMAHEINNPLAGIMQSVEVLSRRLNNHSLKKNKKAAVSRRVSRLRSSKTIWKNVRFSH